jgi:membrane-associated phospholipid phosphatase
MHLIRISIIVCYVLLIKAGNTYGQINLVRDSIDHGFPKSNWKKVVVAPAILISVGLFSATDNDLFTRYEVYEERNEYAPQFHTTVDDYLQYAPIVAVYALNATGIKGQHDFVNRTSLLIKSELFMIAMVLPLKKLTAVPRPDTGEPNSFPSGHTAQAFAAATFLHKEYGREHPLYSVLGYGSATAVGVLRVLNNRHWVSDVLVGAGIGILATNLAYLTHQNKWGRKNKRLSGMMITPTYGQKALGMYMSLRIP